ncbi:hypothetical protein CHLRE_03g199090v5 [Chlamydomonas reinhardtii]|uniref:Uncharacterized protein n=1 Tax=Chlamydomonas reinhardtii TaxID=3055 RepID=A0A2K3DZJ2_CHLRE|nr:uncharacterized protein CHLRE_03g199090v5 [Chlamydomonas reinhardtii]PNW85941.1 hypothetical protein CHLRE_03g199090v5 [Chlamydomonas reinhardtii]
MYLIAQKCLVDVDGVAYVAPPPPPGPSPPHLGAAPTPPLPPLPGTRAARLLLQQPSQHPPPSLPPPPFPPPHPPSSALPAPPTPSSHLTAGQQHWACLLETNPNNTGACGGIAVLWWWSFAMVVPLCLGPLITTITTTTSSSSSSSGSQDASASTSSIMGCLVSGPVFIGMLSLTVVYGITGEELDRTAALADAAGLPGATARRQVIVCAWLGLVGGLVDTFSSMWCTWTGLRTRRALNPLWALLVPVCVLAWPLRRLWRAVREPVCAVVGELCVCWLAAASCLPRRAVRRLAAAEQARRGHSAGEEEVVVVDGQKVYFGEWGGYVRGKLSGNGGEGCDGVHGGDGAGGEVLAGKRGEARGTRAILGVGVFAMDGAEVIVEVGEAA